MKRTVALAVLAAALMFATAANAASVNIFATQISPTQWQVSATTDPGIDVGGIAMVVTGFATRTLSVATSPNISAPDSTFVLVGAAANAVRAMQLISFAPDLSDPLNPIYFPLVAGGTATPQLLVTLNAAAGFGTPAKPFIIQSGDVKFGATAFDLNLVPILSYSLTCTPACTVPPPVPEPASLFLLGLGLAGIALVRRTA